jgi:hypothetical protein
MKYIARSTEYYILSTLYSVLFSFSMTGAYTQSDK